MSVDRHAKRAVRKPPGDFYNRDIPICHLRQKPYLRVHDAKKDAVYFGLRSTDDRFSHSELPFGVLYAARKFAVCCLERFGDQLLGSGNILWEMWNRMACSEIQISGRLCDLTDFKTLVACGTDQASIMQADIRVAQEWALSIARHPADFDGILYPSRFNSSECLALFGKPSLLKLKAQHRFGFAAEPKPCRDFITTHQVVFT